MTRFLYRSVTKDGERQSGLFEAADQETARRLILARGETILDLRAADKAKKLSLERKDVLSEAVAAKFAVELSSLLRAGAPLRDALRIMADGSSTSASLAQEVGHKLDTGGSLADALQQQGQIGRLLARFVEAGLAGVGLENMLARASKFFQDRLDTNKKIQSALAYPVFVILLAMTAILIIIVFVAPALAPALQGQDNFILSVAEFGAFIRAQSSFILLVIAALIGLLFLFRKRLRLRQKVQGLASKLPLISSLQQDMAAGPALDVLGALVEAGTPIIDALRSTKQLADYPAQDAFEAILERLQDGVPLRQALTKADGLPSDVTRVAVLAERAGTLGPSLVEAGRLCRERALDRTNRLAAIAGPFLVVLVGGLVASMMLFVLSGLTSIGESM